MSLPMVLGVVRHLLTVAGGFLVAQGSLDNGQVTEGVGAVCTLAGIAWSLYEKRRVQSRNSDANDAPFGGTMLVVGISLLALLALTSGCASPSRVVTADIRLQCGTNIVTVSQPKDTVIDSLEFDPRTGRLVMRGYQSTASAAAVEATRAQSLLQGAVIAQGFGLIQTLAQKLGQSQGIPVGGTEQASGAALPWAGWPGWTNVATVATVATNSAPLEPGNTIESPKAVH